MQKRQATRIRLPVLSDGKPLECTVSGRQNPLFERIFGVLYASEDKRTLKGEMAKRC